MSVSSSTASALHQNIGYYGGKFISLFQNREVAITTLAITSLIGFLCGARLHDNLKGSPKKIYKSICTIIFISMFPVTINFIMAKYLNMPYSYKIPIGLGLGFTTALMLLISLKSDR